MKPAIVFTVPALLLAGCVSTDPQRKPIQVPPQTTAPTKVGVFATAPRDSNANGYVDSFDVVVYVTSDKFALPLAVPGAFEFRLIGKDKKELVRWNMDEIQTQAALRRMNAGPGYEFLLNVLEVGTDEFEPQAVELFAEFRPREGKPVQAPLTPFRFGRLRN